MGRDGRRQVTLTLLSHIKCPIGSRCMKLDPVSFIPVSSHISSVTGKAVSRFLAMCLFSNELDTVSLWNWRLQYSARFAVTKASREAGREERVTPSYL